MFISLEKSCIQLEQLLLNIFVVPDVIISPFLYSSTPLAYSPQCLWNRCRIIQINLWEVFFNSIGSCLSFVMRNGRIKMMSHMRGSNFVMKKVDHTPWIQFVVWTIDCVESPFYVVVIIVGEMGDINISVLKPE